MRPEIHPHPLPPDATAAVPRLWLLKSPLATHIANAVNLLFPDGERFFVRSVRRYLDQLDPAADARLLADARGFFGQEGRHARAHEEDFDRLRAQGLEIDGFLRVYRFVAYRVLERAFPAPVRLAATAAAEHFTAVLAEGALTGPLARPGVADPAMARLLLWHAAEEIEHKHVAYEVLQRVAPSYPLRVLGLVLAGSVLASFWVAGVVMLLRQEGLSLADLQAERRRLQALADAHPESADRVNIVRDVFLAGIREYLRPGFHPSHRDNYHLASDFLRRAGFATAN